MKVLVTGGGGFLGSRIAQMLRERGDDVTILGRRRYPHLEAEGIPYIVADIREADAVARACRGSDAVFHVAALTGIWGRRRDFWDINVAGTRNVLDACRSCGIAKLIYTSSPSVVFGRDELCGVDESQPYPDRYLAHYPETKAAAERMVLAANVAELATVALRPHLIWGPGDPHLIPRIVARAKAGKLVRVGNGTNLVDITYIDNAAAAHLLACDALSPSAACAGRAYFISQGEPVSLWAWIDEVLGLLRLPKPRRAVSLGTAAAIGAVLEMIYRGLRLSSEPKMTRFVALQLGKSHYFDISAARHDLGYEPKVTTAEGMRRLVGWLRGEGSAKPALRPAAV